MTGPVQRPARVPVVSDALFRPTVENLRNDRQRASLGEPCMTDLGDHVNTSTAGRPTVGGCLTSRAPTRSWFGFWWPAFSSR